MGIERLHRLIEKFFRKHRRLKTSLKEEFLPVLSRYMAKAMELSPEPLDELCKTGNKSGSGEFFRWASFFAGLNSFNENLPAEYKRENVKFFLDYQRQHVGDHIQVCDFAYFSTCAGSHWFLFIVDLNKRKVLSEMTTSQGPI